MSKLRGLALAVLMFLTSYFGTIFMQGPFFWMMYISPSLFRKWIDKTMTLWMIFTGSMLRHICGIKIREFGDQIKPNERAIYLLNHRTRLDFMYLWNTLSRFGACYQEKIILKNGLEKIPGAGWAMQAAGFIFLTRRWENDKEILTNFVSYYHKVGLRPHILIFPEGTNMCPLSRGRSDKYAEKNGLPKYEYVLHPRTTGFIHLLQRMKADGGIDAIYDMTVGYPKGFPTTELQLATGKIPSEVQYLIKRYDADLFDGMDESSLSRWLTTLWSDKEELLTDYYSGKKVFENEISSELSVHIEMSVALYWTIYLATVMYYTYTSWIVFLYFIFANVICIYFSFFGKGFQRFYMDPVISS